MEREFRKAIRLVDVPETRRHIGQAQRKVTPLGWVHCPEGFFYCPFDVAAERAPLFAGGKLSNVLELGV
jgi:hypothetical protein